MSENYFLREIEILCVGLLQRNFFACIGTLKLVGDKFYNINVFLVSIDLSGIDSEKYISHFVIAHERILTVTCQVKVP
jgi:hypothetical protein